MKHIVILGNGIAGITAARHIRKLSDSKITVISGESEHFFSRTALMYIFMGHMKFEHTKPYEDWFWAKNKIDLKQGWVTSVDFDNKSLKFDNGDEIKYDQLVLALGSVSNKFGWKGENLRGVHGLYSLQDLENIEQSTQHISQAVIVGGGLIGVEMAEMLHSKKINVTYLVREKHFWGNILQDEEARLIDLHLREDHHINLLTKTELDEIIGDEHGHVKAIKTKTGETINCEFVGLTVGVSPNISLVKASALETDKGILVDEFLKTNIADVYAIGDCAQLRNPLNHRNAIEAVWYTGRMMGETVAHTITGNKTKYLPGVWFNSAKFFDIEYQTYGNVPQTLKADEGSFYWESPQKKACMKIVFEEKSKKVKGVNLLGIRQRHEIWDRWISECKRVDYVIEHIRDANFNPEFFKTWEVDIQNKFAHDHPEMEIMPRKRSFLEKLIG